ncbi:alpha-2-macroglobulin [Chelatococcus sp. SYSU_G07232]|uniref:Alpha-2-macroglobulin n=1 Tax=Chelatococcus albus TaxID=3047466 RepID=A0ABT7AI73_9HYPH|nr:alpha-2-macroglobulin [Chelatococcus sp. SYSU_G07232]MDJ1159096.1 alpha-2-macroglobulin [Chelatococcus sp. SYSU_G07232]
MTRKLLISLALGLSFLAAAAGSAFAQKSFVRDDLASDALRLEGQLRSEGAAAAPGRTVEQLKREAAGLMARGNARAALASFTAAVLAEPKDAAAWLGYARAAAAIEPKDYGERWRLRERATAAAYTAYQRAANRGEEAAALALLGEVYALREIWRPALDAYRASLALADNASVRATYEDLREKHGFRIVDYKVDSDAASPRACFQFSDPLARGKVDFAPFVAVAGSANAAVSAEDSQLCIDGLKHGERYAVVLRQGLPSAVGEALLKSADYDIYVRDRAPQVRFTGRNYVLPRTGQEGIPVVSVNTSQVEVEIFRIGDRSLLPTVRSEEFLAQLGRYSTESIASEKGFKVWTGTLDTRADLNRDVVTAFPVLEAVGNRLEPGVYIMTARPAGGPAPEEDYSLRATQWFVVSDLGLTALSSGEGGVDVVVRSLATAEPLADVELKLVARNNEVLATKATDRAGRARFDAGLARGTGGLAPGLVVATSKGGDYGFLDLGQPAFDLTDRGVKGRTAPGPLDAFVFSERGVYRSGETVFVTALLRDGRGNVGASLPLTLVARRPDGVEYRRQLVEDQGLGGRAWSLPLLPGAMRGTWRVLAYADPRGAPVGETTFLVEDYVPERLEVTLAARQKALKSGEPAEIDVAARYLYGAPGAALDVTGEVVVQPAAGAAVPGLEGYAVGLGDEEFENVTAEIEESATTDAAGRAMVQAPVPEVSAPRPVEAKVVLRVGEPGGRAVERTLTLPILPKGIVLGVRKLFGELSEGATATFDVVVAAADGRRLARPVQWNLYRVERRYQWFSQDGRWSYEPVKATRRVADGRLDVAADAPARIAAPVQWGSYRLEVATGEPDATPTSLAFEVGYSGEQTADTPDRLDVTLDRAGYRAGEEMTLKLGARFKGKATVMIVGDRVHDERVVDVTPDGLTLKLPVKAEWGPGAYALAFAHRPLDKAAQRMPGRALGLAWFAVDREARALAVNLGAPASMRPRGTLRLPVKVAGLAAGEEARVTVAAVDVGILNLTRYEPPRPGEHFFGQRRLGAEIRDLYGYLIDGMQGTRGAIRSGGDMAAPQLEGAPPTQEPVARYSGVVKVGPDGTALVEFDIPAFNGTLRVMAVAWAKGRVGHATADVVVRDPVVLTGTLPRFLAVGDQSRFHIALDNVEGAAGDYTVDLDVRGPVTLPADAARRVLRLAAGAKTALTIPVTAAGVGTAIFDLRVTGPGVDAGQTFTLRVQPGTPALVRRTVRPLPAQGSVTLSGDLVADLLPGTGVVSVSVSPLAALDVPGLLQALDRYPYGCSEQIVSRALPLLYVNQLAATQALPADTAVDQRIRDAIERVLARQDSTGAFGLWSVGGDDVWLDAFVSDFLTRARERGFTVPQKPFDLALDRLRNHVANTTDFDERQGQGLAYAIYVLARNGRPVMGDLRYLADTKMQGFVSPLARAQIAAALAMLGDRARAQTAFAAALDRLRGEKDDGLSRPDYGSRLRDGAGMLALLAETGGGRDFVQRASLVVEEARSAARWTSTQENAWMVLAASAVAKDAEALSLDVDGAPHKGALYRSFRGAALDGRPVVIGNASPQAAQLVVGVSGYPATPEPAAQQGYAVERGYYRLDGTPADLRQVRQNERLVVTLKVAEAEAKYARLLLVDHLPAGFEIDNPNLVDGTALSGLSWLKRDVEPVHAEYRDDRFVAAFDRDRGQPAFFTVAYVVRAVSPGRYVHPPAVAEDMYRPERFGRTAFGTVEITAAKP